MPLTTEILNVNGVSVVRCRGTLVFGEQTSELHLFLKNLLSETGNLVLNLRGVPYLDSSGMGMLTGIYVSAVRDRVPLKLVGLRAKVRRALAITRLLALFDVHEEEDSAIQSCRADLARGLDES